MSVVDDYLKQVGAAQRDNPERVGRGVKQTVSEAKGALCYAMAARVIAIVSAVALGVGLLLSAPTVSAGTTGRGQWQLLMTGKAGQGAASLRRIACSTASRCLAVGEQGSILRTTDGGRTWSRQNSGTHETLDGVACATTSDCFAVGAGATILATADGGITWQTRATPAPADLQGIACPSARRCIAVGDAGAMVLTENGGYTWLTRPMPVRRALASLACPSLQVCFAVGPLGAIVATHDGGRTWQDQSLPLAVNSAVLDRGNGGMVTLPTEARGSMVKSGAGDTPTLTDVACPTPTTCYAAGGQVVLTTDGRHWRVGALQKTASAALFWSNGVACLTRATCYLVGTEGAASFTTDGGRTWRPQAMPTTQALNGITCPGPHICYAVGDQQTIVMRRSA